MKVNISCCHSGHCPKKDVLLRVSAEAGQGGGVIDAGVMGRTCVSL